MNSKTLGLHRKENRFKETVSCIELLVLVTQIQQITIKWPHYIGLKNTASLHDNKLCNLSTQDTQECVCHVKSSFAFLCATKTTPLSSPPALSLPAPLSIVKPSDSDFQKSTPVSRLCRGDGSMHFELCIASSQGEYWSNASLGLCESSSCFGGAFR